MEITQLISSPILIAFFIGIIIAFQTAYQLRQFASEIYIASLVALSLVRELGPVIGSLIVAARSGASITAGIGSMKISEQKAEAIPLAESLLAETPEKNFTDYIRQLNELQPLIDDE